MLPPNTPTLLQGWCHLLFHECRDRAQNGIRKKSTPCNVTRVRRMWSRDRAPAIVPCTGRADCDELHLPGRPDYRRRRPGRRNRPLPSPISLGIMALKLTPIARKTGSYSARSVQIVGCRSPHCGRLRRRSPKAGDRPRGGLQRLYCDLCRGSLVRAIGSRQHDKREPVACQRLNGFREVLEFDR
jgi:hypothetical protein